MNRLMNAHYLPNDAKAIRAGAVNVRFKWIHANAEDTEWLYFDSDGFICALGRAGRIPRLPKLADNEYRVNRSGDPGMDWSDSWPLTAFQGNLLFEGIWNSAFDPAVFLLTDKERKNKVEESFNFGELSASIKVGGLYRWRLDEKVPLPWQLRGNIMSQALRSFRDDHLLPLKWNVEAARRRLYGETMTLLHRQENLHQFAVMYDRYGAGTPALTRDSLFGNTSDEQLRGYVSLVSAKIPLIDNLTYLAEETAHSVRYYAERQPGIDAVPGTSEQKINQGSISGTEHSGSDIHPDVLDEMVRSWRNLVGAVSENVTALERSFESAWRDAMHHETEQVRIEEEALGELQREASQETEGRWLDTLLFVVTFAVTAAALVDAITHGGSGGESTGSVVKKIAGHHNPYIVPLLVIGVTSLIIYLAAGLTRKLARGFVPRYEQVTRLDEQIVPEDQRPVSSSGDGSATSTAKPMPHFSLSWPPDVTFAPVSLSSRHPWKLCIGKIAENALDPLGIKTSPSIGFAVLPRAEFQRARLDAASEADSIVRLHFEFTFLMSRLWKHRIPLLSKIRFRLIPLPVFYYATGLFYRAVISASRTFPIRRADVQCVIELHRHWPDPGARALLFVREVRVMVVSRKRMSLSENAVLLHFVDSVILQQMMPHYLAERKAKTERRGVAGLTAKDAQESFRDRPLRLSLLSDRIFAFDVGEEINFAIDPSDPRPDMPPPELAAELNEPSAESGDGVDAKDTGGAGADGGERTVAR